MRSSNAIVLCAVLLSGCIRTVAPVGALVSDRPGFSDGPAIVPAGRAQLETGYTYSHSPGAVYHSLGELLIRAGIASRLEVRGHLNSYAIRVEDSESSRGLEDSKIGLKYQLRAEGAENRLLPALSLIGATSIPTGSSEVTARRAVPELKIAANWLTGGRLTFIANGGVAWGSGDRRAVSLAETAAGWLVISRAIAGFFEVYSNKIVHGPGTDSKMIDGGFTWLSSRRIQLDARIGRSIKRDSPDSFFGLGFATRW